MKLRLESVTPRAGATLVRESVFRANLSYSIAEFEPGAFRIITQFDTDTAEEGATAGDDAGDCVLVTRSGRCEIRFPMRAVWDDREITRPFRAWFYLVRKTGTRFGKGFAWEVVAWAGPVRYKAK